MNIPDALSLHRRGIVIGAAILAALVVLLGVVAAAARLTGSANAPARHHAENPADPGHEPTESEVASSPAALASDAASWDAIPPVAGAASVHYPAVAAEASTDPTAFVRAFAVELFTRDYRQSTRADLVAWAQFESAPLRSPKYPEADWTKVLVDSLTDPTWDAATDTPIPGDGPWLALQAASASDTVSQVDVRPDPIWQGRIAAGYQPPDRLATDLDVTLTVTRRATVAGQATTTRYSVALALQLGTSVRGTGYGVAATNNYVIKEMS